MSDFLNKYKDTSYTTDPELFINIKQHQMVERGELGFEYIDLLESIINHYDIKHFMFMPCIVHPHDKKVVIVDPWNYKPHRGIEAKSIRVSKEDFHLFLSEIDNNNFILYDIEKHSYLEDNELNQMYILRYAELEPVISIDAEQVRQHFQLVVSELNRLKSRLAPVNNKNQEELKNNILNFCNIVEETFKSMDIDLKNEN